jgi:hypothetical protein
VAKGQLRSNREKKKPKADKNKAKAAPAASPFAPRSPAVHPRGKAGSRVHKGAGMPGPAESGATATMRYPIMRYSDDAPF